MLMGKLVSRNKYELYEYVTAVLISVGMVLFMFGSHDDSLGKQQALHSTSPPCSSPQFGTVVRWLLLQCRAR